MSVYSVHVRRRRLGLPPAAEEFHTRALDTSGKNREQKVQASRREADYRFTVKCRASHAGIHTPPCRCGLRRATQIAPREEQILTCFMETKGIKLKCSHSVSRVHKYAPVGRRHLLRSASFTSPSVSVASRRLRKQCAAAAAAAPE